MAPSEVSNTPYLATLSLLVTIALLLLVSLVQIYRGWYRLRHIPGPRGAAFSKAWMLRNTLSGSMHLALKRACDEFGKLPLSPSAERNAGCVMIDAVVVMWPSSSAPFPRNRRSSAASSWPFQSLKMHPAGVSG